MRKLTVDLNDGFHIGTCEGIEYEGKLWIVPMWLEYQATRTKTPLRIVRFDNLEYQGSRFYPNDYTINSPIPKDVLDGVATRDKWREYEVIESPPIQMPIDPKNH